MGYWDYFEPSRPRAVKGGIKSQSKRGGFAANWWAKRWIEVLNNCGLGARLSRGRSYARNGQVVSIEVGEGEVKAKVQGSRPKPYAVSIQVDTFSPDEWERAVHALAGQAVFAASLLAGEMPQNIETAFADAGLSLFPSSMNDLKTDCSCPDWSNPCKHTAAVYCLLGEEFDRDPFLIFTLRGMRREALQALLLGSDAGSSQDESAAPAPEPLSADPGVFWNGPVTPQDSDETVRRPPVSAPPLRRLGSFPFWRGDTPLLDAVEPLYSAASDMGIRVYLGEAPESASSR